MAMLPLAANAQLFSIGPPQWGDEQQSAIPFSRAAATGAPAPGSDEARRARYQQQLADLNARLAGLDKEQARLNEPPDYSTLKAQMQSRADTFLPTALAAAAIGMGPESMKPLAGVLSEQAGQALQPMKIEGGQIDASGNVMLDEGYRRTKSLEVLRDRINKLEALKQAAISAEDKADLAAEAQRTRAEYQQQLVALQQGNQELRRQQIASTNAMHGVTAQLAQARMDEMKRGKWQKLKAPDGSEYLYNPDTQETRFPGSGGPDAAAGAGGQPPALGKLTEQQAKAFNAGVRLSNGIPQLQAHLAGGYEPTWRDVTWQATMGSPISPVTGAIATPKGREFFTVGRDILAALLRKESGAAISASEWNQFAPLWLPWPGDSPEQRQIKMNALNTQVETLSAEAGPQGRSYIQWKRTQGGTGGAQPGPGAPGAPAAPAAGNAMSYMPKKPGQ